MIFYITLVDQCFSMLSYLQPAHQAIRVIVAFSLNGKTIGVYMYKINNG